MRFRVVQKDYRYKDIQEDFENLTDALLFMEDLDGQILLQHIDDSGNVLEQWKKNR